MAGATQPLSDGALAEAAAVPAAGSIAVGFQGPGQQEGRQEQQGESPCNEAGSGHGCECCVVARGQRPRLTRGTVAGPIAYCQGLSEGVRSRCATHATTHARI
jgi:hypothetical protein